MTVMEGVIFDVDGTLLDSMSIWDHAGEIYLKGLGISAEPGLGAYLYPMTMEEAAIYLKENYSLTYNTQEIMQGINHTVQDFYLYEARLKPGVEKFLKDLNARKIPVTVATTSDRNVIEAAFIRLKIMDFFQEIFTCSEVKAGKDKPDVYLAAQKAMGTATAATWVFEDALHGAQTAAKAGFPVAGIYDASCSCQEELKKISQVYFRDFNEAEEFLVRMP